MNDGTESHEYRSDFFDYINAGSLASASAVCPVVGGWLKPASVLDVGCGAGAWCKIWMEQGVPRVSGVDGDYVRTESLLIAEDDFYRRDLSSTFDLGKKYELVTSLEVAEHVAEESAATFVDNLARHGDQILFSAAVPGQGGEFHVNEQPLSYWRELFESRGFRCFDPLRRIIAGNSSIEPWYRYNVLLYVRNQAVDRLPPAVLRTMLQPGAPIVEMAPLTWRARNAIIRNLPVPVVDGLVSLKHAVSRRVRRA